MSNPMKPSLTGIEHLRLIVRQFGDCNETFLSRFTVPQLVKLHTQWRLGGWDILPDQWEERQVREALRGITPTWSSETERPCYVKRVRKANP